MSGKSKIEWTDATWNPVRGCSKISPGCKNCYAETFAERFRGVSGHPYEYGFDLRLVPGKLMEPFHWPSPKFVFVNSMSDLFHENIPTDFIAILFKIMRSTYWHTFQILTKRSERMKLLLKSDPKFDAESPNIWVGVSVEDRKYGIPRIENLKRTLAFTKFLSIEPLLEDLGELDLNGIDWVIVGGESGPRARPMRKEWVESIRIQCEDNLIPFFFKQWGGFNKSKNGRILNGRTYDDRPHRSIMSIPDKKHRCAILEKLNWQIEDSIGYDL